MPKEIDTDLDEIKWLDAYELGLLGQGEYNDLKHPYDRLPARAEGIVRDIVWELSCRPMGISVKFKTDAKKIFAKWILERDYDTGYKNTAIRAGGLDCYGLAEDNKEYWVGIGEPTAGSCESVDRLNQMELDGEYREYRIYLPQCTPLKELKIGVEKDYKFDRVEKDKRLPIIYYGTSIVHGGCVSRPGMAHACILQRRLNYPLINIGLSGNARMEAEVTEFLTELDSALFIIDCLPNMSPDIVGENMPVLVDIIRKKQPDVPILFVGDRLFGSAKFQPGFYKTQSDKSNVQKRIFDELTEKGISNLHHLPAANFFGDDFEGTIDGSHPNDLGASRMANALEPVIKSILTI